MNELVIELVEISPREFFGLQNSNIDLLKKYFPKLKIVARGSKIKAYGDEEILEEFDKRLTMLLRHFADYNKLDENDIDRVLQSESSADYETSASSGEVLVHGVSGRLIKAQTAELQRVLASTSIYDLPVPLEAVQALNNGTPVEPHLERATAVGLIEAGTDPATGESRYLVSNLLKPLLGGYISEDERARAWADGARVLYQLWVEEDDDGE